MIKKRQQMIIKPLTFNEPIGFGECSVGPKRKYEISLLMCPDHLVRQ
jgi:hypothetical protein